MAGSICQVSACAVLLVARGAAKAAVAAGVRSAAVARDLATVHAQLLQAGLHLLVWLAVLLNACRRRSPLLDQLMLEPTALLNATCLGSTVSNRSLEELACAADIHHASTLMDSLDMGRAAM